MLSLRVTTHQSHHYTTVPANVYISLGEAAFLLNNGVIVVDCATKERLQHLTSVVRRTSLLLMVGNRGIQFIYLICDFPSHVHIKVDASWNFDSRISLFLPRQSEQQYNNEK
jgi:hypothetical protein